MSPEKIAMCGICVYVNRDGRPIDPIIFGRMTDIVAHRGPDDRGVEIFHGQPFAALGHRRLSIIDLSDAAHQPMTDGNDKLSIILNGEIYNFKEIRDELQNRGYLFRSKSDTEVLLYAFREWSEKCLDKLNGMFSFAIWDFAKGELFAARDRLGIKPIYYHYKGDTLLLSSEIKSTLASGLVSIEPDWTALSTPWHYQVAPETGFKGIRKLEPGHFLRFSARGLEIRKYWDLEPTEVDIGEKEAVDRLSELLRDAVGLQMISDVPIGAFLSGGLDSSCIVALMSKLPVAPIRTFTIRFDESDQRFEAQVDDSRYAREVAILFGCDHREITIKPDIVNLLPKMTWHLDEPLADPAVINTYLISKAACEAGVKVLINGMGGDEIFGGYRKYLACLLAEQYGRLIPFALRRIMGRWAQSLPVADSGRSSKSIRWYRHFAKMAMRPTDLRFLAADMAAVPPEMYSRLFSIKVSNVCYLDLPSVAARKAIVNRNGLSYLTRMCLEDTKHFLPDHNLIYSDKATMAASVEGRPPLLDHRIVEFMFSLHPKYRINGLTQKYLLKKCAASLLPEKIVKRPKASFGVPLRSWIRRDLKEMVNDVLSDSATKGRGLYNLATVRKLVQADQHGKEDNALLIWSILTRELWFRTFIDKPLAP